ncbi:MAG TPA: cupredoxin domain-containing protein, partial [Gemmatimonadales bacterium]
VLVGGLALITAIYWWFFRAGRRAVPATELAGGVQEQVITVSGGYSPATVTVRAGRPVRLLFDRQETNPCSEEIVIGAFGVRRFLPAHQRTAVEFTPTTPGTFDFMCGMGMLHGKLVVQ